MPCDSGMGNSTYDYEARRKADEATRVACDILGALEAAGMSTEAFSPETKQWWARHKAEDAARRQREEAAIRRQELAREALAKLTQEERNALGLR